MDAVGWLDLYGFEAFHDFPAEHWRHLRATNPIESSFATVKLRTGVTKGAGRRRRDDAQPRR